MKKIHSILVAASISLAMALTPSCSDSGGGSGDDPSSSSGNALLLYITANFSDVNGDGELRWMNTNDTILDNGYIIFAQDSKVFANNGKIFVLERPFNSSTFISSGILNCLSPATGQPVSYGSDTLETGSNPYDIAFIDTLGYIAQYGLNYLYVFNVKTCQKADSIPLPILPADTASGASIKAASIKASGNTLFVVMQRWNPYSTVADSGVLLTIDATSKTLLNRIPLNYYNPQSSVLSGGKLYIASAWDLTSPPYGLGINPAQSGIEYVTLTGNTSTPLVNGTQLDNSGTGAGATSMVLGNGQLWTIAYKDWPLNQDVDANVKSVAIPGGGVGITVPNVSKANCLAYDSLTKKLFIGNGTKDSTTLNPPFYFSLKAYNTATPTVSAIDVLNSKSSDNALPPYSLAIVRW
jgi:hypothetical protein